MWRLSRTITACAVRAASHNAVVVQPARSFASHKHKSVSTADLVAQAARSAAGIRPIDTEGPITLVDDSSAGDAIEAEEEGTRKHGARSAHRGHDSDPAHSQQAQQPRGGSSHLDDLSRPPSMPASTTHRVAQVPRVADIEGASDPLQTKSAWRAPSRKQPAKQPAAAAASESQQQQQQQWSSTQQWEQEPQPEPDFSTLKSGTLPAGVGWAAARRAQVSGSSATAPSSQAQSSDSSASSSQPPHLQWTDADFLLMFPNLRYRRVSVEDESGAGQGEGEQRELSSEEVASVVSDLRRRAPELEKLHLGSTWIKVRKWREMLGATRPLEAAGLRAAQEEESRAVASGARAPHALPPGYPPNALHPRYVQPDVHLTSEQVGAMLLRERDLLYLSIERVVVKRLNVLRTHLPGINLGALVTRNPSLLLADLSSGLPAKLSHLRALLPEVNLVPLIEREPRLLNHDVSSFILPRLNLLQSASGYEPNHVLQFLVIEQPHLLNARWNRFKRVEIVREPKFWEWWQTKQAANAPSEGETEHTAAASDSTSDSSSTPDSTPSSDTSSTAASSSSSDSSTSSSPRHDPSTLPFSVYADLLSMPASRFESEFPWFRLTYSPLEREMLEWRSKGGKSSSSSSASRDEGTDLASNLTPDLLASVPGNPQPLARALGLEGANLTKLEAKAAKRMEYLKLKEAKAERRAAQREYMRAREVEHQREKMAQYTARFQAIRARTEKERETDREASFAAARSSGHSGNSAPSGQQWGAEQSSWTPSSSSSPRDSSRPSGSSFRDRQHQKNRAGSAQLARHMAHPAPQVERLGRNVADRQLPPTAPSAVQRAKSEARQTQWQEQQAAQPQAPANKPYRFGDALLAATRAGSSSAAAPAANASPSHEAPPKRQWPRKR